MVIALDQNGEDIIVMGNGIAFQKKRGDTIDELKIERIFTRQVPQLAAKFQKVLSEIPPEYLAVTEKILQNAEKKLGHNFNDNLYLSLIDHIHFAVQRYHTGMLIKNQLLTETRMMYRDEFQAALESVQMINDMFQVSLPEDEAAFITFHFVNGATMGTMQETVQKAKIVQDALTIIRNYFKMDFDESSFDYYRLVTHLKFFVQRITEGQKRLTAAGDDGLLEIVKNNYKKSYECTGRIVKYIQLEFGYQVSSEEKLYLTIHIERIRELNA
ncbi:MAG: PRD domain-containing protein [Clostridiales bacterium]|nr:PRD domain-containing protein [Clostridiales bacterium]